MDDISNLVVHGIVNLGTAASGRWTSSKIGLMSQFKFGENP